MGSQKALDTPSSQAYFNLNPTANAHGDLGPELPIIDDSEAFFDVVKKLAEYVCPTLLN